jgi:WD40 repeat protein
VLTRFGAFRLLSFDRDPVSRTPTVEVAHEALLEEWDRLKDWIDDRRQDLMLSRRIGAAAQEWDDAGRDSSFLLRGARLEQADEWRQATDLSLSVLEVEFLDAGRELHAAEMEKARRLRRRILSGLSAAVVVLTVLALFAFAQRTQARSEARSAEARRLSGAAIAAIEEDPERGVLLALEAVEIMTRRGEAPLPEAIGALQETVQATRLVARFDGGGDWSLAMSGDGTWVVMDGGSERPNAVITDLSNGNQRFFKKPGVLASLAISPDDRLIAAGYGAPNPAGANHPDELRDAVVLIDSTTGAEVARLNGPTGWYRSAAFAPDGKTLIAAVVDDQGEHDSVVVWEISTGELVLTLEVIEVVWARYAPDGNSIQVAGWGPGNWVAGQAGFFPQIVTFSTGGEPLDTVWLPEISDRSRTDPTATLLASDSSERNALQVEVRDLKTGEVVMERRISESQGSIMLLPPGLAWSPDGRLLAVSDNHGVISVIDVESGEEVTRLAGNDSLVSLMAFTPDGRKLVSAYVGGDTLVWDVTPAGPPELEALTIEGGPHAGFAVAVEGNQVGVFTTQDPETEWKPGGFEVHNLLTGEVTMTLTEEWVDTWSNRSPSPDLSLVGSFPVDGNATIRKIPTNEVVAEFDHCTNVVAFSPDNSLVLINRTDCGDETSQVIRIDSQEPVLELYERLPNGAEEPLRWVYSAAFNPEGVAGAGRYLALTNQVMVQLWDIQEGSIVGELTSEDWGGSLHVAFDPGGRFLSVGTLAGRVWVADMERVLAGKPLEEAMIFDQVVHAGPARPSITEAGILATAGSDGLVRLLDIRSGKALVEFRIGPGPVPAVAFAPDGSYLLYTDEMGTVLRRLYLDPERLVAIAHQRLTRQLTADECRQYLLDWPRCTET